MFEIFFGAGDAHALVNDVHHSQLPTLTLDGGAVLPAAHAAGVFLLTRLLAASLADPLLSGVATLGARILSSLLNFFMNKNLVFKTRVSTGKAMAKYYALAVPQMVIQWLLNQAFYTLLHISPDAAALRTLIHILVMTVLFLVSFTIQQRWVFAPQKSK